MLKSGITGYPVHKGWSKDGEAMRRHSIRCHKCHDFVEVEFTRGPIAPLDLVGRSRRSGLTAKDFAWFAGECPRCGATNYLRKPSWVKGGA